MRFESPWFLLLLLLLPVWWWLTIKRKQVRFVQFSEVQTLKLFASSAIWTHPHFLPFIRGIVLTLLIIAMARPQTGRSFTEVTSEGVDIVLAIDTSGSMKALDLKLNNKRVTRLDVVKDVLAKFIENRLNDRVGMVVFGDEAYTQSPLTHDHELLIGFLDQTYIGMAGDRTAIGSAIAISSKRLKDLKAQSKVMVLLTDGENTAGKVSPEAAAEAAKELGIKIYTVGVGGTGKAPVEVDVPFFGKQLQYFNITIDEVLLKKIAKITGGHYFRAKDTESLERIYDTIDKLEKTEAKVKEYHEYEEHFKWFLIPAFLLFLIEFILAHTRLRRLP